MTIRDVVDTICAFHPPVDENTTWDGFKCGNPGDDCTGIVTTCHATIDVIRRTIALNYNLIIVHEPTYYNGLDATDWLEGTNEVYAYKKKLLSDHGIAIWRNHDRIHNHKPDHIFYGVSKVLGWDNYINPENPHLYRLPVTTPRKLASFLKEKLSLNGVRLVGNMDGEVSSIYYGGHINYGSGDTERWQTKMLESGGVDVIIPAEQIDWTTAAYVVDAWQMGKSKAIISLGHYNMEEPGMQYAAEWISRLIDGKLPVKFIQSSNTYQYN